MDPNFIEVNEITNMFKYLQSIDWTDPWLIGLVCFHLLVTVFSITSRKRVNVQIVLFLILLLLVYFSESINELAAMHWQKFSRQQYFDSNGMFLSIVFSVPILLNCMFIVGSWLMQSTQLMVKVKESQLKQQAKQRRKAEGQQNTQQHPKNE